VYELCAAHADQEPLARLLPMRFTTLIELDVFTSSFLNLYHTFRRHNLHNTVTPLSTVHITILAFILSPYTNLTLRLHRL